MKLKSIILITAPLLQYNHWVHLMKICIGKLFSFLFIYAYAVEGYYSEQSFWKSSFQVSQRLPLFVFHLP